MRKWYAMDNLRLAFKHVKSNNSAPGIDGETVKDFQACFEENLAAIHAELKTNTYQPSPVRRVEIEKEGNCHPNPRGGPWAYSKSHQNTHHVTMGRMGTASNRPESLPSGMDSIFPASQLPKAPSGSHGMDPQKTTDEEDAGMEKLERSVQSSTPEGSPWRLPENLHASLAQFGQSFAESSSAQQLIHGDWPFGPNEVQCWYCVAVL